jgi:hypothetical protein
MARYSEHRRKVAGGKGWSRTEVTRRYSKSEAEGGINLILGLIFFVPFCCIMAPCASVVTSGLDAAMKQSAREETEKNWQESIKRGERRKWYESRGSKSPFKEDYAVDGIH